MRLRFLFLPLIAVAPVACRSTDSETPPATPTATESTATELSGGLSGNDTTGAPASTLPQADAFREDGDAVTRKRTQRAYLSGQAIQEGDALLDRADLEGALVAYSYAINIDPASTEARQRMQKVEALLGHRYAVAADALQDEVDRARVKQAQARIEAGRYSVLGDAALGKGKYEEAIQNYRQAEMILRFNPLIASESLDERIITGKLNSAIDLREEARREDEMKRAEAARLAREQVEAQEREYIENRLVGLFQKAKDAFLNGNYSHAEDICDLILMDDPGNEAATVLRENSTRARHQTVTERNRRDYREQWLRAFADLDQMNVIQTESVVFDDIRRWREVTMRKPLEFSAKDAQQNLENASVNARLDEIRFPPQFVGEDGEGAPLADVATYLQSLTGVNFVISTAVREELGEEETMVNLQLPERSVRKILELIADTNESSD